MIDIHNHLLPAVDDGSKTIEESIEILKNLADIGYKNIILTPHYIKYSRYTSDRQNNLEILETLKQEVINNNIDINLYLGNEIFYDNSIKEMLNNNEISSLNNTKYLLIELPLSGEAEEYESVFDNLIKEGYTVILAHPERYLAFQKDYNKLIDLEKDGVIFQCNIESILGRYGNNAKKMIKRMLKEDKVSILATDIHHRKEDYNIFFKAKKRICKFISEDKFNSLVNPSYLIN